MQTVDEKISKKVTLETTEDCELRSPSSNATTTKNMHVCSSLRMSIAKFVSSCYFCVYQRGFVISRRKIYCQLSDSPDKVKKKKGSHFSVRNLNIYHRFLLTVKALLCVSIIGGGQLSLKWYFATTNAFYPFRFGFACFERDQMRMAKRK